MERNEEMTKEPSWTEIDTHADALLSAASRLAVVWPIVREAERSGRPAQAEAREVQELVRTILGVSRKFQAGMEDRSTKR